MLTEISSFITLLFYTAIVSQSISYIISLTNVQRKMNAAEYISFRKQTDKNFRVKFPFVIYGALLTNLLLIVVCVFNFNSTMLICSIASFVCLVIDTWITLKGNMPVNNAINSWTIENLPGNWERTRADWLRYFRYRQIANLTGFLILVAGIVFS